MFGLVETFKLAYWPGPTRQPDANDEPVPPEPAWYDDSQAAAAAYGAAVAHVINRPDGIRARAQVSATISAAVAAALAAFAPLTGLASHQWWPQVLVALAVLGWLVSLWRYILVIAYSFHDHATEINDETTDAETAKDDAKEHLRRFLRYAAHIRARVERGTAATIMALGFTLAGVAALAIEPWIVSPEKALVVSLSDDGRAAVESVCDADKVEHPLGARGLPGDLDLSVVPLKLAEGACKDNAVVVHLRRGWIVATRRAA